MQILSFHSNSIDAKAIVRDIISQLGNSSPHLILIYMTVAMPIDDVMGDLTKEYPKCKLAGSTSCMGVMTDSGYHNKKGHALGGIAFYSDSQDYGVGFSSGKDRLPSAREACENSLRSAGKEKILPNFLWMIASPGHEEKQLEDVKDYFGTFIPLFGGSAADNDISGQWKLFHQADVHDSGLLVVSFFDIPQPLFSFHSGYQETTHKGIVTKAEGRKIIEIDHRPSAIVYNEWTNGLITESIKEAAESHGKIILNESSLQPLARKRGKVGAIPFYLLSHPETITSKNELTLFTEMNSGEELILMEGSPMSLKTRASKVVDSIFQRERINQSDVAGALVVFCAGCMLTISASSSMEPVVEGIKNALGKETPFLGVFTFGEQGCFFEDLNFHGNLMISVTLFLKDNP